MLKNSLIKKTIVIALCALTLTPSSFAEKKEKDRVKNRIELDAATYDMVLENEAALFSDGETTFVLIPNSNPRVRNDVEATKFKSILTKLAKYTVGFGTPSLLLHYLLPFTISKSRAANSSRLPRPFQEKIESINLDQPGSEAAAKIALDDELVNQRRIETSKHGLRRRELLKTALTAADKEAVHQIIEAEKSIIESTTEATGDKIAAWSGQNYNINSRKKLIFPWIVPTILAIGTVILVYDLVHFEDELPGKVVHFATDHKSKIPSVRINGDQYVSVIQQLKKMGFWLVKMHTVTRK